MIGKLKVFIGTEEKTEIARKVLQHSIIRRTECDVEFIPMIGKEWEYDIKGITVGTGFSLRRWMIPAFCKWEGRAIYLDADQLVLADLKELWDQPNVRGKMGTHTVWCTYQPDKFSTKPWPQSSVMVIDCAKAKGQWGFYIDQARASLVRDPHSYANFMHCKWLDVAPCQIPTEWNHLNTYVKGKTKLLHYTKEPEQPWYKPDHPLADHWRQEFMHAISMGSVTPEEIKAALAKWGVKEDWRRTNGLHPEYKSFLPRNRDKKEQEAA